MKLISMTDFVLEQGNPNNTDSQFTDKVIAYAKFLKQPLKLWMFVPCDENGNFLEEPIPFDCTDLEYHLWCKAKERCLFKGLDIDAVHHHIYQKRNIEYLANFRALQLTHQTALKQIGL